MILLLIDPAMVWCLLKDSNLLPLGYQPSAHPHELHRRIGQRGRTCTHLFLVPSQDRNYSGHALMIGTLPRICTRTACEGRCVLSAVCLLFHQQGIEMVDRRGVAPRPSILQGSTPPSRAAHELAEGSGESNCNAFRRPSVFKTVPDPVGFTFHRKSRWSESNRHARGCNPRLHRASAAKKSGTCPYPYCVGSALAQPSLQTSPAQLADHWRLELHSHGLKIRVREPL